MLEIGKVYKAIKNEEKLIEFEVLKINKKSYTIILKGKKETLWINNSDGRLYLNNSDYSSGWSRNYQPSKFDIKIINEKEYNIWSIKNEIKYNNNCIIKYSHNLKELETEIQSIKNKINELNSMIDIRNKEIERLENELNNSNNIDEV